MKKLNENAVRISLQKGKSVETVHLIDRISIEMNERGEVVAVTIEDANLRPVDFYK